MTQHTAIDAIVFDDDTTTRRAKAIGEKLAVVASLIILCAAVAGIIMFIRFSAE